MKESPFYKVEKFDVLRGIAIISVFLYHNLINYYSILNYPYYRGRLNFEILNKADFFIFFFPFTYGWIGVQLFLIISGFLIHLSYLKGGGEFSVKSFFNKRFWRIYPPYIVFLLIFCIWFGVSRIDLNNFILHILLLQNFSRNYVYSINGAYWSLALEAQLYFIYPFFLLLLKKIGINYLLILLIALNLIFSIYEGVCHINPMSDIVFTAFVLKSWVIWGMGAWLSNFYFQNKKIKISFPVVFVFIVGFYVIFFFQVLLHFVYLYVSVFLVYLIASYISTKNSLSKIEVWLSRVGKISYSFYLIHGPLINILRFGLQKHFSFIPINYCTTSIFSFGIIYLISEVSYNYLEKPSIEIGKRFYKKFQSHIL